MIQCQSTLPDFLSSRHQVEIRSRTNARFAALVGATWKRVPVVPTGARVKPDETEDGKLLRRNRANA